MSLLLISKTRDMNPLRKALLREDPNLDVDVWPAVQQADRVQFAVAWNQPKNVFDRFPNLKVISSLGAGADHLLDDSTIPQSVRLTRIVAPSLSSQMADYVLTALLNLIRKTDLYYRQQRRGVWKTHPAYDKKELTVGIMGMGELGRESALRLAQNGFTVNGWSRSKKNLESVNCFGRDDFGRFLSTSNIVVNLLPLTPETDGILNLDLFKSLRKPAFLINAARGSHLVEEDLIYALDTDIIRHAVLDVFTEEPLPESHPFWGREKLTVTPHIASVTDPIEVAPFIIDNYKRMLSGLELLHEVNRERGY
jgi:glyoxylate/hydroxypyruvate reductase